MWCYIGIDLFPISKTAQPMTYILFEFSYPKIPGFKKAIASTAMPDS
jgi:hypothetical protein